MNPKHGGQSGWLNFILLLLLISCVFDPADKVLGLKVWLFILCWVFTLILYVRSREQMRMPLGLLIYVVLFILIPTLSIIWYYITNGAVPFEGFVMLKGYILITLAPLLVLNRVNLLPRLCAVLTVLALLIIGVFLALLLVPEFYGLLYALGPSTGILFMDNRQYSSNLTLLQIYFVTSPMLAISIAYYYSIAKSCPRTGAKWLLWVIVAINVIGMLLAGTRNNILAAILLPIALAFIYAKHKTVGALFGLVAVVSLTAVFTDELQAFFNPTEHANQIKLSMLSDYARAFSDPLTLVFGQGLGAYVDMESRGYVYVTELTYLEVIRNFGLFGAAIMFSLLLFPVWHAFTNNRSHAEKAIAMGYTAYLVMCISNPNMFSSMGVLILSIMLGNIFLQSHKKRNGLVNTVNHQP
jgi:hypothetical protein